MRGNLNSRQSYSKLLLRGKSLQNHSVRETLAQLSLNFNVHQPHVNYLTYFQFKFRQLMSVASNRFSSFITKIIVNTNYQIFDLPDCQEIFRRKNNDLYIAISSAILSFLVHFVQSLQIWKKNDSPFEKYFLFF